MSTGRRIAVLGVALGALAAIPLSLLAGAWVGGAIPFQAEAAATVAGFAATTLFWLGHVRAAVAVVTAVSWRNES
jgi:hypothetical protein